MEDNAEEVLDVHLRPRSEWFLNQVQESLFAVVEQVPDLLGKGGMKAVVDELEGLQEFLTEDLMDWLPTGQLFVTCLAVASSLRVAPHRVFLHLAFDESIVDPPWTWGLERRFEGFKVKRRQNFGPYLGRFPPTRWKHVGRRQCIANQIRVWTCHCLEELGATAREAMKTWDEQQFHDHPFQSRPDPLDRTTSPAESNYIRDKKWLRRRLTLCRRPYADMPALEQEMERDRPWMDKDYLASVPKEERGYQLGRLLAELYLPEI